jgi:hypothetical protein
MRSEPGLGGSFLARRRVYLWPVPMTIRLVRCAAASIGANRSAIKESLMPSSALGLFLLAPDNAEFDGVLPEKAQGLPPFLSSRLGIIQMPFLAVQNQTERNGIYEETVSSTS